MYHNSTCSAESIAFVQSLYLSSKFNAVTSKGYNPKPINFKFWICLLSCWKGMINFFKFYFDVFRSSYTAFLLILLIGHVKTEKISEWMKLPQDLLPLCNKAREYFFMCSINFKRKYIEFWYDKLIVFYKLLEKLWCLMRY